MQICYESLDTKSLGLKLDCCEEMDKIVSVLEGSMSRTKGFILKSLLDTLQYMKSNNIHIDPVKEFELEQKVNCNFLGTTKESFTLEEGND